MGKGYEKLEDGDVNVPITKPKHHKHHHEVDQKWLWCLYGVLLVLSVISLAMTVTTVIILSIKLGEVEYSEINDDITPSSFLISKDKITPVKPSNALGTTWIASTISLVESELRSIAIKENIIKENEYIELSENAYGKLMIELCKTTDKEEIKHFCEDSGITEGKLSNGNIEMLYYFRNHNSGFFYPSEVCENEIEKDATDIPCEGVSYEKSEKKTPFEVSIKKIESKYTPESVKEMLHIKNQAVGFEHSLLGRSYLYPCDEESPLNGNDDCVNQRYPCSAGYCSKISSNGYDNDGIFKLEGELINRGDHSMSIVGWNDDFMNGGFILKNSLTYQYGHSLGYFLGNHSLFNEDQICPTYNSIKKWIPMNYECFIQNKDTTVCPNITRVMKGNPNQGATVLKCNDEPKAKEYGFEACLTEEGKQYNYALEMTHEVDGSEYYPNLDYPNDANGYLIFNLIRWIDGQEESAEVVKTQYTTWQFMEKVFSPKDLKEFENSNHCGYFFMSYEIFLQHHSRAISGGQETYVFSSFEFDVDKEKIKDTTQYKDSIHQYELPTFTGSLDL